MSNFIIFEGANDVIDAINITDIAKEVISQSLSFGSSTDNTSNINNLQYCGNL
jgi:hypothetical protein